MDRESFEAWISQLTAENRLSVEQRDDLLSQRDLFEQGVWRDQVSRPERDGEKTAVGLVRGEAFSAPTVGALMFRTTEARDGAMMYFEVVTRRAWEEDY
jgi:hypothetical protein